MANKFLTYKRELVDAYLTGFYDMLDKVLSAQEEVDKSQRAAATESPNNINRDNYIPIYMYCKNLWDKWLISGDSSNVIPYQNNYTVDKFFPNFLFIDSFYRNVFNLLCVNCQQFIDLIEDSSSRSNIDNTSLYSFLGNLASKSKCLFVAIPDYINLGSINNDGCIINEGLDNLKKIFNTISVKDMKPLKTDNKFIVIYTHEPSKTASSSNGFLRDTFDLCDSDGNLTSEAEKLFGMLSEPSEGVTVGEVNSNMETKGFPVPSFAVAFGGLNNHIFKGVEVNMDNPIATEQSINITAQIAQLGANNAQSVAYQGQDVYPIFSNYAYQCTVTMMGNAQVQPLMYFQLMNIPMWKGAYMIFNVKHQITPGNMTTTFTGMRMSKNCVPFLERWAYPVTQPEGITPITLNNNPYNNNNNNNMIYPPLTISNVDFGNFEMPPIVRQYLIDNELSRDFIIQKRTLFENAKKVLAGLIQGGINSYVAYYEVGGFATECGWVFTRQVINDIEYKDKNKGPAYCGEGWTQLSLWENKTKIIQKLNLPVPTTEAEYNEICKNDKTKMISGILDWDTQLKIVLEYIKMTASAQVMTGPRPRNEEEQNVQAAAAFLNKGARSVQPTWDNALRIAKGYGMVYFTKQYYHALMLALYIKNGKVPTKEETDIYIRNSI